MPAPTIRADHELLKRTVQSFSRESAAVKRLLDRLHSDMDALQRGDWIGQAANRFYQEMQAEVLPAVERLRSALDQGAQATKQMSRIMEEAEAEAARLLGVSAGAAAAGGSVAAVGHALGQQAAGMASQPARPQTEAGKQGASDTAAQILSQFDPRVRELARASPTLQSLIDRLGDTEWRVVIGPPGGATYADSSNNHVVIDGGETPEQQVNGITHEAAHVLYGETPFHRPNPEMTRKEFIELNVTEHLRDEANSQFHEAEVRHEIQQATGTDVGISGVKSADYARIYTEYSEGNITRAQAIDQMTAVVGDDITGTTKEPYREYYAETYENWWDEHEAPRRQDQ